MKKTLIDKLTETFENRTARAAAINEIIAAAEYRSAFDAIVGDAVDATEALLEWAIRRGQLWA